jgi:hypothetical protein
MPAKTKLSVIGKNINMLCLHFCLREILLYGLNLLPFLLAGFGLLFLFTKLIKDLFQFFLLSRRSIL